MNKTLVLQSHREPLPTGWLTDCLKSVKGWSDSRGYDYRFIGDELFERIPGPLLAKCRLQMVVATDIGRLQHLRQALQQGYETVIWCDADVLMFNPGGIEVPEVDYALGREIWIATDSDGKLRAHKHVHNAFMLFRSGNSFLDFYLDTAMSLLERNSGKLPPQFLGPKLLTALHNVVQCPVIESVAMLSPEVIADLLAGGGPALELFNRRSVEVPAAVNLCCSLALNAKLVDDNIRSVIPRLLKEKHRVF